MKTSQTAILRLMLTAGLLPFAAPPVSAVCLDETAGWSKGWREIKQPEYTLQINNLGGGAVLIGKSRFAFPGLLFFDGNRSCSMSSPLCGTGAWNSVAGEVAEAEGQADVTIEGVIADVRIKQVYHAMPDRVVWEWLAEVVDPTPEMRWFRFEGILMYCAGFLFTAWLQDGGIRRGILDPSTFREMGNVRKLEVLTPSHAAVIEWLDASGITVKPNQSEQQPHIPLRYLCHGAQRAGANSSPALMPGEQVRIKMQIMIKRR